MAHETSEADRNVWLEGSSGDNMNNSVILARSLLRQQTSTGTWGEERRGKPVCVEEACEEFELARKISGRCGIKKNAKGESGEPVPAVKPLYDCQVKRDVIKKCTLCGPTRKAGAKRDKRDPDVQGAPETPFEDFDLGEFIRARYYKLEQADVDPSKPVGISWKDLEVRAPGTGSGGVLVKTLPKAIYNTIFKDPIGVAAFLLPPFRKFLDRNNFKTSTAIIQGHDGILRAGEMLLVLGRPGSGCSTFLRALTASNHANVLQTGKISFGGLSPAEIIEGLRGEVLFCDEDDIHFPTLTVAQTLRFALKNKVPTRLRRPRGETRQQFIDTASNVFLKMFSMSHVGDTIVGDAFVRGVSGGERKRVSISEALVGSASVVAWDNSTRGLDASTALDYVRSLRIMTDLSQRTTMATLYQVSESILNHFDRVAVMDAGRCIYYGPRDQARKYFCDMGCEVRNRESTADFITGVTDPDHASMRSGFVGTIPRTPEERERHWKSSSLYVSLMSEVESYDNLVRQHQIDEAQRLRCVSAAAKNTGVSKRSSYMVNYWEQVKACIWRQLLIRWGSRQEIKVKLFIILSLNLALSAIFYGQAYDSSGVFTRGGVILHMCLFNGWLQLSEGFEAVAGRPVLMRHRQFAFNRPSAVVFARAIVDIPFLMVQCFLSLIIIWGVAGLRREAGAFFIYYVYVFLAAYNLTALYRMIAAFSPSFNEMIRFSALALNVMIFFVGYVIRRPQMNWLIWLSYVSGLSYAFEGMLVNEIAYAIPCASSSIVPFGELRDVKYQTCAVAGSRPGAIVVSASDYLKASFGYTRVSVSFDWAVLLAFSVLYFIPTVLASEMMDWSGTGGGVTVFIDTPATRQIIKEEGVVDQPKGDDIEAYGVNMSVRSRNMDDNVSRAGFNSRNGSGKTPRKQEVISRAIFTWRDIGLSLSNGRRLLQGVDGWVKPGEMTALMGASGAGKTTLMSTLSGRGVMGVVTGERLIDGKALDNGFEKDTGLVLQADNHLATSSVREALEFSARLRQPAGVSDQEKMETVEYVLDILELRPLQDALIGIPGAGLGVERRKRVTIGVELVAKPDLLLFLDEPTSGLDSAGAASIVRLLRKLSREGQAILCTIHQPSSLLFESFDNVLLLQPGGKTAYFGRIGGKEGGCGSASIREYFERNGAPACPVDENAAEYILEVVSGSMGKTHDWNEIWRRSPEAEAVRTEIDSIVLERVCRPPRSGLRSVSQHTADVITQLRQVSLRQLRDAWRDSSFSYGVLFSNMLTGLIAGGSFAHIGTSPTDLQNRSFIIFLVLLNTPAIVNAVISKFFEVRRLFEIREGPSRIYTWWALVFSFIAVSVPIALLNSVLFFIPSYFIPFYSQPSWSAGFFYLNVLTIQFWMFFLACILSAACPNPVTAANFLPFILPFIFFASGVIVPQSQMPEPFRSFVYYVVPISYYVKGQVATVLHNQVVVCGEKDIFRFDPPSGQTCSSYAGEWVRQVGGQLINGGATSDCGFCRFSIADQFAVSVSSEYDYRWQNYGIFLAYTLFEIILAFFCYWLFNVRRFPVVRPVGKLRKRFFGLLDALRPEHA